MPNRSSFGEENGIVVWGSSVAALFSDNGYAPSWFDEMGFKSPDLK